MHNNLAATSEFWAPEKGDANQMPSLGSINICATIDNLVARATRRPGFVHPCPTPEVYKSLLSFVDNIMIGVRVLNIY